MPDPDPATVAFQAALEAHRNGDLDGADRLYRLTLEHSPAHSPAANNLGLILALRGRPADALAAFRRALDADPRSGDAAVNLAQALAQLGRHDEALRAWRDAAARLPGQMEPPLAAALIAARRGDLDDAATLLEQAAQRDAQRPGTRELLLERADDLAAACIDTGRLEPAHRIASLLLGLVPEHERAAAMLAHCLAAARVRRHDPALKADLLRCHRSDAVDPRELSRVTADLLLAEYPALASVTPDPRRAAVEACGAHRDELLLRLLDRGINVNPALEACLTALRRELLDALAATTDTQGAAGGGAPLDDDWRAFLAALAAQCWRNEYVFAVGDRERTAAAALEARLADPACDPQRRWEAFAAFTCCRAPAAVEAARALAASAEHAPAWVRPLLRLSVTEPLEEARLRADLARADVDEPAPPDPVSGAVRRQYEESPYPRWHVLARQPPRPVAAYLGELLPAFRPPPRLAGPVDILVAGCGTGEHALRTAARHPDCRVTAVDLSAASLAYAMRKARELRIANVAFLRADILDLGHVLASQDRRGPERFAVIESVGVLHHMGEPEAGLRVLADLLAADGVIKLGLYSRRARTLVIRARERIAALGLGTSPDDVRAFRERVRGGAEPGLEPLTRSSDFHTLSSIRDLLFHVQEHRFDTAGLRRLLDACGLRVVGFQLAPRVRDRYLQRFPDDPALTDLDRLGAFEDEHPDTFAGMYQFWCATA